MELHKRDPRVRTMQPFDRTMAHGQVQLSPDDAPSLANAEVFPRQPWRVDFRGRAGERDRL